MASYIETCHPLWHDSREAAIVLVSQYMGIVWRQGGEVEWGMGSYAGENFHRGVPSLQHQKYPNMPEKVETRQLQLQEEAC